MAQQTQNFLTKTKWAYNSPIVLILLVCSYCSSCCQVVGGCYTRVFAFGDSLTDTGNYMDLCIKGLVRCDGFICGVPPYGETFFHRPTGRCTDGRLIVDFIAEHYGLDYLQPYSHGLKGKFGGGVNFAIVGATTLRDALNISMATQINRFKTLLSSFCKTSNCDDILRRSLIVFGPFGGNDYFSVVLQKRMEDAYHLQHIVVKTIASAIEELIEVGVLNIMVPGMLPDGCLSRSLSSFYGSRKEDYDPQIGCLIWLNKFSQNHNQLLQRELTRIQDLHPNVFITYADYYHASLQLFRYPQKYGFNERALDACCGSGGPYNADNRAKCGQPTSHACDDPSSYIQWDGAHLTEAAYRWITNGLLSGFYTIPNINATCHSSNRNDGFSSYR